MTEEKGMTIYEALSELQHDINVIQKNQSVNIGKYAFRYADIGAIREAIRVPMHKWGFSITQTLEDGKLVTCLLHKSGEMIKSSVKIPETQDLKTLGAALTYLRRYSISAILNLASDDDIDAGSLEANGEILTKKDAKITKEQGKELLELSEQIDGGRKLNNFLKAKKLVSIYQLNADKFEGVKTWLLKEEI